MGFRFWDGDGKARVVEDVLEGEEVAVDDEGGDAASVDRFEGACCPVDEGREGTERGRSEVKSGREEHEQGKPSQRLSTGREDERSKLTKLESPSEASRTCSS